MASKHRGASTQEVLGVTALVGIAAITAMTALSADVRSTAGCFGQKVKGAATGQTATCKDKEPDPKPAKPTPTPKKT